MATRCQAKGSAKKTAHSADASARIVADYDDKTDEDPTLRRATTGAGPVLEPNEARGGVTHHNVRVVLVVGLALIVVASAIVYVAFFAFSRR